MSSWHVWRECLNTYPVESERSELHKIQCYVDLLPLQYRRKNKCQQKIYIHKCSPRRNVALDAKHFKTRQIGWIPFNDKSTLYYTPCSFKKYWMSWTLKTQCATLSVKFHVFIVCLIKAVGSLTKDNGPRKLSTLISVRTVTRKLRSNALYQTNSRENHRI